MKKHLLMLLRGLRDRGVIVMLAGSGSDLESSGTAFRAIDIVDGINIAADALAVVRLRRLLAPGRWSLVHAHGWKAGMITALARCPRSSLPMVLTLHNELSPRFAGWRRRLLGSVLGLSLRCADAIVCVSTSLNQIIQESRAVAGEKLATIVNGVDLSELDRIARPLDDLDTARPRRRFLIGTVARMIPEKGISDLLRAFAIVRENIPEARLVLVGDGPARPELELEARTLGVAGEVTFTGWRADACSLICEFDVFVLPSWSEGTPMTVIEAMVIGTPVVVTGVGGVRDLVEHMRTGVVVRARSPQAIARAVELLIRDRSLRAQLSHAAREEARRRFSHTTMIDETIEVYRGVLQGKGAVPTQEART